MSVDRAFDVAAVEAWVARRVPTLTPPFEWTPLQGGHSNFTFRLRDVAGAAAVIRRPPLGELLPKAHDMGREWALLSALDGTAVPAPRPIAFCDDGTITGAHFYLMSCVDGRTLHTHADIDAHVPLAARPILGFSMIDSLAALHGLDPEAIGLTQLGTGADFVARQLRSWGRGWTASAAITGIDDARADALLDRLSRRIPPQGRPRIVHGDCGFHNCIVGDDFTIAAIVDWEICTLGDPIADLAYALVRWPGSADAINLASNANEPVDGLPEPDELVARYREKTGAAADTLDFHLAFNLWKSASIAHGVYARYRAGNKAPPDIDLEEFRDLIDRALTQGCVAARMLDG